MGASVTRSPHLVNFPKKEITMYGYNNMPPPWMWGMGPPSQAAPQDPVTMITQWQTSLDALKKAFKEEKKDDPKKKGQDVSVISMMLFMLLIAPVTGPAMFHFFQLTINMMR